MKTQRRQKNKRWVGVVFGVLLVGVVFGVLLVKEMSGARGENESADVASGDGTSQTTDGSSSSIIEDEKEVNRDEPPTGESLGVWVTSKSVSDGVLRLRVQIDQNISNGTCRLVIGGYVAEVAVMMEPQSASCMGFDVAVGEYMGNEFEIEVVSGVKSGRVEGLIYD